MLAKQAITGLITPIKTALVIDKNNNNDVISSAINFLSEVAQSEREKEIRVIKRYIEEIKSNPIVVNVLKNPNKNRDDLTNLISSLEAFSANPSAGVDLKEFYQKLVLLINTIRSSIESYKERLDQLLDKNRSTTRDIRSDFMATRIAGDIDTLMRNLTGTVQREKESALSTRIVKLLIEYADTHLRSNITFLNNPVEVLIALMIDFEKFLQKKHDELGIGNILNLEEMDIENIFKEYTQMENNFLDKILQNNTNVLQTLEMINSEMGLRELKSGEEECRERERILGKVRNSKTHSTNPETRQTLNDILSSNGKQEISNYLRWNVTTAHNNRHGNIYEFILPIIENSLKVRGHAAVDILTMDLGEISLSIDTKELIYSRVDQMRKTIETMAKIQRENRKDDLIEYVQQMNKNIQSYINSLNQILKDNKIPDDIFIYHQSLKLYTQIEEHKTTQFHGRNMQILNMLDNLYSLDNITGLTLVDQSIMYGAVINLSEMALGHTALTPVENYLSIFAGLLMFDDIQNMAWDIARTTTNQITSEYGQAYNIHLYLVNDIYVPGSMLLTTIAEALKAGYTEISSRNGARVTIDTSEADKSITNYLEARASGMKYNIDQWQDEAENVASGTKAQITFLSSFFTFLSDMQQYLQ